MNIEYEATFINVNKEEMREKLKQAGAKLTRPEFLQKRVTFHFPAGHHLAGGFVRVRDEADKITMSVKIFDGEKIEDQKEICLTVDDFERAIDFLKTLGCQQKSYQETEREIWEFMETEICLDTWPFLEPLLEIEGASEAAVKAAAERLDFNYAQARFCPTGDIYCEKYDLTPKRVNNETPRIVFEMENPFLEK